MKQEHSLSIILVVLLVVLTLTWRSSQKENLTVKEIKEIRDNAKKTYDKFGGVTVSEKITKDFCCSLGSQFKANAVYSGSLTNANDGKKKDCYITNPKVFLTNEETNGDFNYYQKTAKVKTKYDIKILKPAKIKTFKAGKYVKCDEFVETQNDSNITVPPQPTTNSAPLSLFPTIQTTPVLLDDSTRCKQYTTQFPCVSNNCWYDSVNRTCNSLSTPPSSTPSSTPPRTSTPSSTPSVPKKCEDYGGNDLLKCTTSLPSSYKCFYKFSDKTCTPAIGIQQKLLTLESYNLHPQLAVVVSSTDLTSAKTALESVQSWQLPILKSDIDSILNDSTITDKSFYPQLKVLVDAKITPPPPVVVIPPPPVVVIPPPVVSPPPVETPVVEIPPEILSLITNPKFQPIITAKDPDTAHSLLFESNLTKDELTQLKTGLQEIVKLNSENYDINQMDEIISGIDELIAQKNAVVTPPVTQQQTPSVTQQQTPPVTQQTPPVTQQQTSPVTQQQTPLSLPTTTIIVPVPEEIIEQEETQKSIEPEESSGLSPLAIGGIVGGSILVLLLIVAGGIIYSKKSRKGQMNVVPPPLRTSYIEPMNLPPPPPIGMPPY